MEKLKKIWNKLIHPSLLIGSILFSLCLVIVVATIVLLCLSFNGILMYILYGLSALSFTYMVYIVIKIAPLIKTKTLEQLNKHKFTKQLLDNYGYRSFIFASWTFICNILFAIAQGVIAILSRSIWYGALALYYIIISIIRGRLVTNYHKLRSKQNKLSELKTYRNSGISLLLINLAFVSAICQMVIYNQTYTYAGLMIYVMATYAFYKLSISIYNLFKSKKNKSPIIASIKIVGFADALVSILALQTALLSTFGNGSNATWPNALVGGTISLAIIAMGIYMIVNGQKKIKKINEGENNEQEV